MNSLAILVIGLLTAFVIFQVVLRLIKKLIPGIPAPPFLGAFLDSKFRRTMQPAEPMIRRSGVHAGMRVLELGCGSGCYTPYIARAVGAEGKVVCLDIEPKMLKQLETKLNSPENADIRDRVELVRASAHELPFADNSFDLVVAVTVLPEIPDQHKALLEARRVLKPGACFADTECVLDPDIPMPSTVAALGTAAGFEVQPRQGSFWTWTMLLKKPQ